MTVKLKMVWAVVALWAVAAGSTHGHGEEVVYLPTAAGGVWVDEEFCKVPVTWREAPVAVDAEYAEEHPEQRGLQTVVAADREVLHDHEERILSLEKNPAQSQGGDTTPAEGVMKMTFEAFAGAIAILGGIGVGVLVWIAVVLSGRRGQVIDLASTANAAAQQANGPVRVSGTDGAGGSYALRIDPPAGEMTSIPQQGAQGSGQTPAPTPAQGTIPAQQPAPVTPPPGTPAQPPSTA